jgi:ribbon-helix-helix CopG family protein
LARTSYPPTTAVRREVVKLLLSPDEKAELVQLAQRRGRSVNEVIRCELPLSTNREPEREREAA